MIISQLSISPIGKGISLGVYVKEVIKILKKNNIKFVTNPMSTIIETTDLKSLFDVVNDINKELFKLGVKRIITELKIDYRTDKNITMEGKLKSIK